MKWGISIPILVAVVAVVFFVITGVWSTEDQEEVSEDTVIKENAMRDGGDVGAMSSRGVSYYGNVLAENGNGVFLLDFNRSDYENALMNEDLVVLYFYASWCPICRVEFPRMQEAFRMLDAHGVVGFRVNYNDSDTDEFEKGLAREHGVAYQHTKVFIRNGEQVLKSPESWKTDRYLKEINNALAQ